jgi:hypothetical protein
MFGFWRKGGAVAGIFFFKTHIAAQAKVFHCIAQDCTLSLICVNRLYSLESSCEERIVLRLRPELEFLNNLWGLGTEEE